MWRCRPQAAMVMKMKRRSSLDISVAESEAKLDARACRSLVGGVATFALMKLIAAPISDATSKDSRETVRQKYLFSIKTILISTHYHVSSYRERKEGPGQGREDAEGPRSGKGGCGGAQVREGRMRRGPGQGREDGPGQGREDGQGGRMTWEDAMI